MTLTIYGPSLSPFVRKVRVFLAEKGQDYTLEQVNIFPAPDWFVEISPLKRVPVLRDDSIGPDATLPDSSAICGYLEKKFAAPALYPADAFACGKALWYEEYADSDLAGNIGMGVFRPMIVSRMMGKEPDTAAAEKTMSEKLPRNFAFFRKGNRNKGIPLRRHLRHCGYFRCDAIREPRPYRAQAGCQGLPEPHPIPRGHSWPPELCGLHRRRSGPAQEVRPLIARRHRAIPR